MCRTALHCTLPYSIQMHWPKNSCTAKLSFTFVPPYCQGNLHRFLLVEEIARNSETTEIIPTCSIFIFQRWFSKNRPFADSFIESRCQFIYKSIYISMYLSPSHVIFFEASHWPSGHMIRSRPLIGRPPLLGGGGWWWPLADSFIESRCQFMYLYICPFFAWNKTGSCV